MLLLLLLLPRPGLGLLSLLRLLNAAVVLLLPLRGVGVVGAAGEVAALLVVARVVVTPGIEHFLVKHIDFCGILWEMMSPWVHLHVNVLVCAPRRQRPVRHGPAAAAAVGQLLLLLQVVAAVQQGVEVGVGRRGGGGAALGPGREVEDAGRVRLKFCENKFQIEQIYFFPYKRTANRRSIFSPGSPEAKFWFQVLKSALVPGGAKGGGGGGTA